jgi:hypothetical protein
LLALGRRRQAAGNEKLIIRKPVVNLRLTFADVVQGDWPELDRLHIPPLELQLRDHAFSGTPEQWANESNRLAKAAWVRDGTDLDQWYYQREIKVADRQMALAGLRLAKLLNETIGKMTPRDFH